MQYKLTPEDMYNLLDYKHVAIFGKNTIQDGDKDKERKKFIKRNLPSGIIDPYGHPTGDFAKVIEPVIADRLEVSLPTNADDPSRVRLIVTFFVSDSGITCVKRTGLFKTSFELTYMQDSEQLNQTLKSEFDLYNISYHERPFCYMDRMDKANELLDLYNADDHIGVRKYAQRNNTDVDLLGQALESLSPSSYPAIILVARIESNYGSISLYIDKQKGSAHRIIALAPGDDPATKYISFELMAKGSLWDYIVDFKGL